MNEEIKNEIEEVVCVDQIENNGKGIIGKVVVGGVAIVAASVGAWLYKRHKDKNIPDLKIVDGEFTEAEEDFDESEEK